MRQDELRKLVDSTGDASFVVGSDGLISAWNAGAERLFGRTAIEALGQRCGLIVKGSDECGPLCSENCTVRQAIEHRHPLGNFDLQVDTVNGRQWCNVSVLTADDYNLSRPCAVYIFRPIDLHKRLEIVMREFVVTTRAPARDADLSPRELEVLRLLARGESSKSIGEQLHISRTTANNHVQHILQKLGAHNRLEAVRRAEHAGLI